VAGDVRALRAIPDRLGTSRHGEPREGDVHRTVEMNRMLIPGQRPGTSISHEAVRDNLKAAAAKVGITKHFESASTCPRRRPSRR
jgi:hypothetical protein